TTLAALGFAPSTADPSLFLRTDTSLPPFYILVYVDDQHGDCATDRLWHLTGGLRGAMAAQELRWLTYLLTDLGEPPRSPPVLYVDNKAMLALCREQRLEHRTKHIALRYFLARELQQRGQLRLAYVASEANTADVFTKALAPCDHQRFCTQLGLRDYELHPLNFGTAFLQGSLHEEIWLRRPPGFTELFPAGTQWSLRWPVYGLRQAPRKWHNTLRTTLVALRIAPSTTNPSLFLHTDTSRLPFYVLVYVDDLIFASADTEALTLVKSVLQKRHTCTDLGELRSYLGLQIIRDRARRTITLTQSHMVHQVLQHFGFLFSLPEPTPLSTSHSLSAPPSDESVELSGLYPELVGCLMYLMTCTRPDLAYPLSLLARYVAPAGLCGSGGVRGAGEAGRGVVGGSAPIASVSTPGKDNVKAFNLEKFSGEDWESWSFRMELLFNHYGLLEVMDGELKRPASEGATKEWDRRSKDGFFLLSQCLSSNQLHHVKDLIKDIQCGPKAWKILMDLHAPSSEAMVVVLERQLHVVKINEGDAVQGAFDQLRDLYVKLSAAGVDYPEKIKCYKALSLLPESWGPLVVNLNGMKDSWSLEWIRAQVLQEEFWMKELTAGEGGGSAYGMKGFKGRGSKKGKAKEGSGGEQYSVGKRSNKGGKRCGGNCWYCHVEGHPWFKCRKLPDGWRPGQPSIEGSKGVHGAMGEGMGSEEGDGGAGGHGGMFYHVGEACSEDMVVSASKVALHRSSHWVIDTGAFMTMTNREDLLDEVRPSKAAT
ncbi:unnamed protein product, partial [Closterium sp. NIES-53]